MQDNKLKRQKELFKKRINSKEKILKYWKLTWHYELVNFKEYKIYKYSYVNIFKWVNNITLQLSISNLLYISIEYFTWGNGQTIGRHQHSFEILFALFYLWMKHSKLTNLCLHYRWIYQNRTSDLYVVMFLFIRW